MGHRSDLQSLLEDLSDGEMNNGIHLHEICFCNRFESDLLYYLGFTAKGQVPHSELQDDQTALETYTQFTQMMEHFVCVPPLAGTYPRPDHSI